MEQCAFIEQDKSGCQFNAERPALLVSNLRHRSCRTGPVERRSIEDCPLNRNTQYMKRLTVQSNSFIQPEVVGFLSQTPATSLQFHSANGRNGRTAMTRRPA